jgi:ATP-binding protein involved in chromosome partitioning
MSDPRVTVITERLSGVKKVIAVCSGKGGVGKSVFASTLALSLSKHGYKVGLLDIDFTSPSTHVILNVKDVSPSEEKGIIPPLIHDLRYMSITYYSGDHPTPLRGIDVSNVLIELLATTKWGALDFLVLDLPPGLGDLTLDTIRLIKAVTFLIITTPSKIAFETVRKLIQLLTEQHASIVGIVENMKMRDSPYIREQVKEHDVSFLGEIAFDPDLEDAIGDINKLRTTKFMNAVEEILSNYSEITNHYPQR